MLGVLHCCGDNLRVSSHSTCLLSPSFPCCCIDLLGYLPRGICSFLSKRSTTHALTTGSWDSTHVNVLCGTLAPLRVISRVTFCFFSRFPPAWARDIPTFTYLRSLFSHRSLTPLQISFSVTEPTNRASVAFSGWSRSSCHTFAGRETDAIPDSGRAI